VLPTLCMGDYIICLFLQSIPHIFRDCLFNRRLFFNSCTDRFFKPSKRDMCLSSKRKTEGKMRLGPPKDNGHHRQSILVKPKNYGPFFCQLASTRRLLTFRILTSLRTAVWHHKQIKQKPKILKYSQNRGRVTGILKQPQVF
jgi:hypothetical protein